MTSITNNQVILWCFLKACQTIYNPKKLKNSWDKAENNQPFKQIIIIPSDINNIQPRSMQVCNCDEIGFDANVNCHKFIFTYKFLPGEHMFKVQTVELEPFWCTLLDFNWVNGKLFMLPIIVHKAKDYSQNLLFDIPLYYIYHHTPSGHMSWYKYLISVTQLSNVCGSSSIKNWILFFGGNDIHFYERAISYLEYQNIKPFVLNLGDYDNGHPNYK